jgi:hypothetical protein
MLESRNRELIGRDLRACPLSNGRARDRLACTLPERLLAGENTELGGDDRLIAARS